MLAGKFELNLGEVPTQRYPQGIRWLGSTLQDIVRPAARSDWIDRWLDVTESPGAPGRAQNGWGVLEGSTANDPELKSQVTGCFLVRHSSLTVV